MIECQICKKILGTLSGKHLKNHGLSSVEYREKFPGYPTSIPTVVSDETRIKMGNSRRGKKHNDETKAKIGAKHKGKIIPRDVIERQKASYKNFLEKNGGSPQKGSKRSEDFGKHMREVALVRSPELVQKKVKQMLEARLGSKATDEQRKTYSEARLKYITENPDKINKKLFNTKPEQEFEQILIENKIKYKKNSRIGNRLFDFQLDNILIELDGPFHYDYRMYGSKSVPDEEKIKLFEKAQERDRYKDQLAKDNGFEIYRIQVGKHLPDNWREIIKQQGCIIQF